MARFDPGTFQETEANFSTATSSDEAVVSAYIINGMTHRIKAMTVTTKFEFRGLGRAAAEEMAKSADYNFSDLHGVRFESGLSFMAAPDCEGEVCKAEAQRINDADFFRVIVTHARTTASHTGNWKKTTF